MFNLHKTSTILGLKLFDFDFDFDNESGLISKVSHLRVED